MSYKLLTTERRVGVEYLTLNRPEVRNAMNDELVAELAEWAARTRRDRAVRVVVLGGAGKTFSAGADVSWMAKAIRYTEEENVREASALFDMFEALDTLPVPLIGRIQGAALGGGVGLAAVCDVVVADDEAVFGFTEVKLGIVPAVISPFALAKVGRSAARELFLTGARFSARRAREIGLVHQVVPTEDLDRAVDAYVREFLAAGPEAVAAAKALISQVAGQAVEDCAPLTARIIAERRVSTEGQEGLRAFLEKRQPDWGRTSSPENQGPPDDRFKRGA
jgi:methylglutaconyl-CoA hydratase